MAADKPERQVALQEEYITLGQLLKLVGAIGAGGEAKSYLALGNAQVNGEPEERRGRKLRPGDRVTMTNEPPVLITARKAR